LLPKRHHQQPWAAGAGSQALRPQQLRLQALQLLQLTRPGWAGRYAWTATLLRSRMTSGKLYGLLRWRKTCVVLDCFMSNE